MAKSFQKGEIITLLIHGLGSHGEGVGAIDGFTVFVDGGLPGEIVQAELVQVKKKYAVGKLLEVEKKSPSRVVPPCPYFGTCGGCQLQHLAYEKQLEVKKQRVVDAMRRIGKIADCPVADCIPSPKEFAYRNKIQLPVRDGLKVGLFAKGSHDLIEIDACLIHSELGERVYQETRDLLEGSGLQAYDPASGKGELRNILIKSALKTGQALVVLISTQAATPNLKSLAKKLIQIDDVRGVVHNLHSQRENVILGKDFEVLEGEAQIQERLCDLTFNVSTASFFQVNPFQAENLYMKALEFGEVGENEVVFDAYCGVGTMSLIFARNAGRVLGVESVPQAIENAKENARLNEIENISFICASSETSLHLIKEADLLVINPPRKGCDSKFIEGITKYLPKKIVYVSCDPATLARDLALIIKGGYRVDRVQPFDMFPQTAHVECVARLTFL